MTTPSSNRRDALHAEMIQGTILLVTVTMVLFVNLDGKDLWHASEARPPEVARNMVESGNWIHPMIQGDPYLTKPPLYAWTVAALFRLTGQRSVMMARLPAAVSALLVLMILYAWGRRTVAPGWAYTACIVLALSFRFVWHARLSEIDMMLTLWTTLSLLLFFDGFQSSGRRSTIMLIAAHVALGLGFLTKGHTALIVVLGTLVVYAIVAKKGAWVRRPAFWTGFAASVLIALPWFVEIARLRGWTWGWLGDTVPGGQHRKPFWFYLASVPAGMFPWTLLLPFALALPFRRELRQHQRVLSLAFVWFVTGFAAFSILPAKQSHYLLPYYPALAILTASVLGAALAPAKAVFFRLMRVSMYATFGLMTLAPFALLAWGTRTGRIVPPGLDTPKSILLLGVAPVFFVVWFIFGRRHTARRWASTAVLLGAVAWIYVNALIAPTYNARKGVKRFALRAAERTLDRPVMFLGGIPPQVDFYMNRSLEPIQDDVQLAEYLHADGEVYLLTEPAQRERIRRIVPDVTLEPVLDTADAENDYVLLKKVEATP
jgi:4-amino-4-deoxy-L-arabinose transferase-like glycosyltransferase